MSLDNGVLKSRRDVEGGGVDLSISFDGDDSYPTDGTPDFTVFVESILAAIAAAASDKNVRGVENYEIVDISAGDCGQYVPSYDKANDNLFVRDGGDASWSEVADTTDLSTTTFNVTVFCK